ncbi:hypothetical protein CDD81_4978 [Ophiocordyceps australis]|uniref:Uncharacterized protein n=1 Tax=Ophiocordyceps australis TaxID=1399860 RepID=A0A2C5Y905_9HYPO|nr:hypothetical protein CDD81_4978 [Ophiocordyceps australis]
MASTAATYGKKKRNLLRSLGSHRRQRCLSPLSENQVQDRFVTRSNPVDGNSPRVTRRNTSRHSDSIDKIASALLDDDSADTIPRVQKAAGSLSLSKSTKILSINQPPQIDKKLNPLAMNPVWLDSHPAISGKGGGKQLSRSISAPFPATSVSQCRDHASFDYSPRSVGLARIPDDEDSQRQISASDSTCTASPFHNHAKGITFPHLAKTDEINEKVRAMLAATEALKPTNSPTDASCKTSRIAPSRMLTKVTNAWERLYSRPSTPQAKDGNKRLRRGDFSEAQNRLSAGSAEEFLGDKNKTSKNKGHHQRQRASGSSLATNDDVEACPQNPQSPFESEKGFEYNLQDRILTEAPIGYSTPRAQSQDGAGADGSAPEHDLSEMQVDVAREVKMRQEGATRGQARQLTLKPSQSTRSIRKPMQVHHVLSRHRTSPSKGCDMVKKHPSPSKEDLEQLEQALQRHEAPGGPVLSVKDKNQMIRRRSSTRDVDPLSLPFSCSRPKSRLQRPSDDDVKRRSRIRLGPPFRSVPGRSEELDELF